MSSLFDDATNQFLVLVNDEKQRSIWPEHVEVPTGWRCEYGPADKPSCSEFVTANWIDLRPKSLINLMKKEN
ncbi:MbtH family protein [Lentilitoribacter sp. EG35]|uniref:MbtH family protein n=1 Tax=Lentilitoribacter sp. EG35 TaxID=3234192 RepID=UPI00345F5077